MMKKKILIATAALSIMVAGVVSAASMWGSYKGNDIIRLTVDGVPAKVSDAPAFSYDNRTMIPIYLLQQAGVKYTWDQKNKTVDIQSSEQPNSFPGWAYCAAYHQKLNDISTDFTTLSGHLITTYAILGAGINDSNVTTALTEINKEIVNINVKLGNIYSKYTKDVHQSYNNMNLSTKKMTTIETNYNDALKSLTSAYTNLSSYKNTWSVQNYNDAYSAIFAATTKISDARQKSNEEFNLFQEAIIANQH